MVRARRSAAAAPTRRSPNLERDKVVRAALEVLNEAGFEGLTLRKLADKLGVKAAALYWHFKNKQDLIDQVAGRIIEDEFERTIMPEDADWRMLFTIMAHGSRNAFMRYRDGALVIARADLSKTNAYKSRDYLMTHLLAHDFPAELVFPCLYTISRYTLGAVLEEQADPNPGAERAAFEKETLPEITAQFPAMGEVYQQAKAGGNMASDVRFNTGLQFLLDGVAQRLTQSN